MRIKILIFIISIILFGCEKTDVPISSNLATVKALSIHSVEMTSYEIPKGIFRGALWPSGTANSFQIWIIDNDEEKYFTIKAPPEFVNYKNEVTEEWDIALTTTTTDIKRYIAQKKVKSKSLQLDLPIKKRDYSFSVLNNSSGNEILIFMDLSEDIIDEGFFGYVTITNRT